VNVVVADQTDWGKLRVAGADRVRFLQGMLSNDVAALSAGGWARSVLLNPKGRVLAIVDAVNEGDSFLLATEPVTARKLEEVLAKHAIMDDVSFTPEQRAMHRVWPTPESVWTAPPVFAQPVGPALLEDVEARRIEAGLPRYEADVSEDYFPFEANLDSAISYTKGCYIGQEVVARANARGHANKRLVGLRVEGEGGAIRPGTTLASGSRPDAGRITSSIVSPAFGPIALGYVHKTAWDPGTRLRAGERALVVAALPFR
jgi:folate-binding protein YgfZ